MLQQFGQKIRTVRQQRGIGLNALAKKLDISPAYLSNLENGKTETINLSFLEKIESELSINSIDLFGIKKESHENFDEFHFRVEKAANSLKELNTEDANLANYILTLIEHGVDLRKDAKSSPDYH